MASNQPRILGLALICLLAASACGGGHKVSTASRAGIQKNKTMHPSGFAAGREVGYFIWPVPGPINSPYGFRHGRRHVGIDIGGDEGAPVYAAAPGEVVFEGKFGDYGNFIVLKHDNGLFTAYGHNEKNLVDMGDRVKQGQRIAKLGSTGNASGDHLHFEIRDIEGVYDPLDFLPDERYSKR
ncbi:MAG: M23 family metallopeptidase [Deltaproteobacteria bacterium]|nr:M23 family metallopeptidase [Deltaproteobacteria bacterium]